MPFRELQRRSNNLTSNPQGTPKSTPGRRPRSPGKIRPPRRAAAPAPSITVVRCGGGRAAGGRPGEQRRPPESSGDRAPVKKDRFSSGGGVRTDGKARTEKEKGPAPSGEKKSCVRRGALAPPLFLRPLPPLAAPSSLHFVSRLPSLLPPPCFCPHRPTRNRQPSGAGGLILAAHALALCFCRFRNLEMARFQVTQPLVLDSAVDCWSYAFPIFFILFG